MVARSERMARTTTISMSELPLDPRILGDSGAYANVTD
jgi:hypothetical protein